MVGSGFTLLPGDTVHREVFALGRQCLPRHGVHCPSMSACTSRGGRCLGASERKCEAMIHVEARLSADQSVKLFLRKTLQGTATRLEA
jgi:hypothetical protein